jgi:hypothetical protein
MNSKMTLIIVLLFLLVAVAAQEQHVLFYYKQDKDTIPGFMKQMKHDVERAKERLVRQQEIDKATLDPQAALQRAFAMALGVRIQEMNCAECENTVCQRHSIEMEDPCVSIEYDEARDMCKVSYKCKIVDIGDGQRTVAPIGKAEARQRLRESLQPPPKIKYL